MNITTVLIKKQLVKSNKKVAYSKKYIKKTLIFRGSCRSDQGFLTNMS